MSVLPPLEAQPPSELATDPATVDPAGDAIVTDPWVVRAVAIVLGAVACLVVLASAVLAGLELGPLPDVLVALAPTSVGALAGLLAGTLTQRAR